MLLHVERAAAIFAIVVAVASVLHEAMRGRLPTQLTTAGIAYETGVSSDVEQAVEHLQTEVDRMQASIDRLGELTLDDDGRQL